MAKKSIIGISLMIIIGFTLIVILPIQLILINLLPYGIINDSLSFPYNPSSPSSIEKLYINADEANVEIKYIDPEVDYYSLIEVNLMIIGVDLGGKSYEDYLNIQWNQSSSPANFTISIISDDWYNPSLWAKKEINIILNLRKDIVFSIITNLNEGNYEIAVPWEVSIGDLITNVSLGNISYDFEYNTFQGDIIGNLNDGDLIFKLNNVQYAQNSSWDINAGKGNLHIEVFQYRDIGANITGIFKVNNGDIFILYEDNSANIGAILEIPYGDPFMNREGLPLCIRSVYNTTCTEVEGFDYHQIASDSVIGTVSFTSFDLLANIVKNYYSMRFEIFQGSFGMSLSSNS